MEPITNSVNKENIRKANFNAVQGQINAVINKADQEYYALAIWDIGDLLLTLLVWVCPVVLLMCLFSGSIDAGFLFCLLILVGGALFASFNNNTNKQKRNEIRRKQNEEVNKLLDYADRKTLQDIKIYEQRVKEYSTRILKNSVNFKDMVDHQVMMFERMISHSDNGSHIRFVEADLIFTVINTGVIYSYHSKYTNEMDDYNFNKRRFRNLGSVEECEGLAQALAKLTIREMQRIYGANSINITVSHMDSCVTLHFRGTNKNFVPARNIF